MISWVYIFVVESNMMYIKFCNFSWMKESHEIHENLNPMKINTHTVCEQHGMTGYIQSRNFIEQLIN